jgi:hypothetical protein
VICWIQGLRASTRSESLGICLLLLLAQVFIWVGGAPSRPLAGATPR